MPPEEMLCTLGPYKGEVVHYTGRREAKYHTEYMGYVVIGLLLASLFLKPKKEYLIIGVLSLIICFGRYTPLYHLVYLIPPNGLFRSPSMAFFGFVFSSVALGAGVIERFPKQFIAILCLFTFVEIFNATDKYRMPTTVESEYYNVKDCAEFLKKDTTDYRIWVENPEINDNRWTLWKIKSLGGHFPLVRKSFVDSVGGDILPDFSKLTVQMLKQYNVKYVISDRDIPRPRVFTGSKYNVYKL